MQLYSLGYLPNQPELMKAIIIYDGVCGFCNSFVRFVIRRDPTAYFLFVSSQSTQGKALLEPIRTEPVDSIVLAEAEKIFIKSDAVLQICGHLRAPWRWLSWLSWVPKLIRDSLYDWFASHRYFFGVNKACPLPTPDEKKRILS